MQLKNVLRFHFVVLIFIWSEMQIKENVSLKDKNWFRTGGNARFFLQPRKAVELQQVLLWAKGNKVPVELIGEGANLLISDKGYDGLIIQPNIKAMHVVNETNISRTFSQNKCRGIAPCRELSPFVTIEAGATIQEAIDWSLEQNLTGLEQFSGIPGTIGGATYINIHYFEAFLSDFLIKAQVIDKKTGELITVDKEWFHFGYDESRLHDKSEVLVNITLKLKRSSALEIAYAKGRRDEIIRHRNRRYPTERTCGCFFRNFSDVEISQIATATYNPPPFVGYYLDRLGVKGELSHGDATVSYKHANMLVNQGNATSTDIIMLARKMQELVHENFGLIPQPECQLIGFDTYPLHTDKSLSGSEGSKFRPAKSFHDNQPSN